jgi:hypothetical protein
VSGFDWQWRQATRDDRAETERHSTAARKWKRIDWRS